MLRISLFEMLRSFPWFTIHLHPFELFNCPLSSLPTAPDERCLSWSRMVTMIPECPEVFPPAGRNLSVMPSPHHDPAQQTQLEQPFLAPPCQWEDFCQRLDGKETSYSCRMESLTFNEGITQTSKSYRPWKRVPFLSFFMSRWSILVCEKIVPKAAIAKSFNPLKSYLTFFCPSLKLLTLVMAVDPRYLNSLYDQ